MMSLPLPWARERFLTERWIMQCEDFQLMLCKGWLSLCKRDIRKLHVCDGDARAVNIFPRSLANPRICWLSAVPKSIGGFGTSPKALLPSAHPARVAQYPPGAGPGQWSRYKVGAGTRMEDVQRWSRYKDGGATSPPAQLPSNSLQEEDVLVFAKRTPLRV